MMEMMKMEFEEQFPSFAKEANIGTPGETIIDTDKIEMMNTCLDKQVVKDAIDKILPQKYPQGILLNKVLKEELGLEDG